MSVAVSIRPIAVGAWLRSFGRWCSSHLIQTVPEEHSVCEYECQEAICNTAKLAICEKRTRTEPTFPATLNALRAHRPETFYDRSVGRPPQEP